MVNLALHFLEETLEFRNGFIITLVHWAHELKENLSQESAFIFEYCFNLFKEHIIILLNIFIMINLIPATKCTKVFIQCPL